MNKLRLVALISGLFLACSGAVLTTDGGGGGGAVGGGSAAGGGDAGGGEAGGGSVGGGSVGGGDTGGGGTGGGGGGATDAGPPLPDLVVTDLTWSPASAAVGDAVLFSATVKNQGTAATPAATIVGVSFWVDGTQVSWSDSSQTALAVGATRVLLANGGPSGASWTATAGSHSVRAWVDDVNRIMESDEANNELSRTFGGGSAGGAGGGSAGGAGGGAAGGTAVTPTPQWPFDQPSFASSTKKVFAHWHWFPPSFDGAKSGATDYYATQFMTINGEGGSHAAYGGFLRERPMPRPARPDADWDIRDAEWEVKLAKGIGVDGFFLNMWNDTGNLWNRWMAVFDGAARQGGFGVIPNFDVSIMSGLSDAALSDVMVNTLSAVKTKSSLYRMPDGRVVMGVFLANLRTPGFYQGVINRMQTELGLTIYFVPVFLGTGSTTFFSSYAAVSGTLAGWGTAIPQSPTAAQTVANQAKAVGKPWMHPVLAQDFRPYTSGFWEAQNSLTERSGWATVINSDQSWVQIVTWNDQGEHHALRPATGKQWSAYDLAAYYIAWFKTGVQPPIVRDALYYFHRVHRVAMVPTNQTVRANCNGNCPGVDEIELLAFLTAPGTLEIEVGGVTSTLNASAGMTSFRAPLRDGTPIFRLRRNGVVQVNLTSAFEIKSSWQRQDLLYRGGSSLRAAMSSTYSCATICQSGDVAGCTTCPSEPMWLPATPL